MAFFFIDFIAALWEPLGFLGPVTIFHYYDPLRIAQEPGIPVRDTLVLLADAGLKPDDVWRELRSRRGGGRRRERRRE